MSDYEELSVEQKLSEQGIETHYATVGCGHCGKLYRQRTERQMTGCREMDYDICPYCGGSNGSSMQVDFYNSKYEK